MVVYGALLVLAGVLGGVGARITESNWATIHNERPPPEFNPAIFTNNPKRHGQMVNNVYAALYIDNSQNLYFGQATEERDGRICATFNELNRVESICGGFRVLVNERSAQQFTALRPERVTARDLIVQYNDNINHKRTLVLMYEPDTDSSYYGTLVEEDGQEPVVYGINYENAPVEVQGAQATSGDYVLYIVKYGQNL